MQINIKGGKEMKKVLWISRHKLGSEAINELHRHFNDFIDITEKNILFAEDEKQSYQQLLDLSHDYDVIGGVFPAQLWLEILKHPEFTNQKELFVVVSKPVMAEDGKTRTFIFDHISFSKLNKS